MRARYHAAGFRILECMNHSNTVIEHYERTLSAPPKLTSRLIVGDDAPERQRNSQRNLIKRRTIYWMITAEALSCSNATRVAKVLHPHQQ